MGVPDFEAIAAQVAAALAEKQATIDRLTQGLVTIKVNMMRAPDITAPLVEAVCSSLLRGEHIHDYLARAIRAAAIRQSTGEG